MRSVTFAWRLLESSPVGIMVSADRVYDARGFVKARRKMNVTPDVAQNTKRTGGTAIDGRIT